MAKEKISKKVFEEILESFAKDGKLFSNEYQFQLEVAWELKERGYEVFLEVLDSINGKKSYIDIVIKIAEDEHVAIELKYTTKQNNINYEIGKDKKKTVCTFAQGAGDVRQLDFLYDVHRLECLLSKGKIVKGYAIIMTNDKYSEKDGKNTKYEKVALYKNRTINPSEEIGIKIKGYEKRKIKLEYSYICQWSRYNLENTKIKYFTGSGKEREKEYNENPFEYMIWEVSK